MIRGFLERAIIGYRERGDSEGELAAFRARDQWDKAVAQGDVQDIPGDSKTAELLNQIVEIVPRDIVNAPKIMRKARGPSKKKPNEEALP